VRKSKPVSGLSAPTPGTPGKPINLRDLAAYLGLSRSTISLVLNNSPVAQGLKPETRERVLKAATELGYKPNYFARMLNNKRSQVIGILSPDLGEGYNASILTAIERLLIDHNYLYFVSSHHWNNALIKQRLQVFAERGIEGLILINTPTEVAPTLPSVFIGSQADQYPLTSISLDNAHGIRLALEHLYALGHRKIAFLKGHMHSSDTQPRWTACKETAHRLGLPIYKEHVVQLERIDDGLNPIREGYVAGERLLKSKRAFTALLAFNDLSAIGAMNAFRDAGKQVPEEISVVGFDDISAATLVRPSLTTVRQPLTQMGVMAATELLARIEDASREPHHISVKPELMIRQSSAVCPRG
jgi:DNA-binding LacI/PurR family transcriptional regulator